MDIWTDWAEENPIDKELLMRPNISTSDVNEKKGLVWQEFILSDRISNLSQWEPRIFTIYTAWIAKMFGRIFIGLIAPYALKLT